MVMKPVKFGVNWTWWGGVQACAMLWWVGGAGQKWRSSLKKSDAARYLRGKRPLAAVEISFQPPKIPLKDKKMGIIGAKIQIQIFM